MALPAGTETPRWGRPGPCEPRGVMRRTHFLLLPAAALLLVGCPPAHILTDGGHFAFESPPEVEGEDPPPGVHADPFYGFRNSGPVLAGTTICLNLKGHSGEGSAAYQACGYEVVADGVDVADGCYTFAQAGTAVLSVEPTGEPCADDYDAEPPVDQVSVEVVDADALSLGLLRFGEHAATVGATEGDAGPWPDEWPAPWPDPLRVVEGEPVLLHVGLLHDGGTEAVAFNSDATTLTVITLEGDEPGTEPIFDDGEEHDAPYGPGVRLRLASGSRVQLQLTIGAESWTTGEVIAVPLDDIATLDVLGAYSVPIRSDGELPGSPLGARAVARDADGNPVLGAPVTWTLTGHSLQVVPGSQPGPISLFPLAGDDYVWLYDGCFPPDQGAGTRQATLRAKLGSLSDSVALTWERGEGEPDEDWVQPEYCNAGCGGCSTGASPGAVAPLALLAMLLLPRRRRS